MKQVVNIAIGGKSFIIEDDAYALLQNYLGVFRSKTQMGIETNEVMDELEMRMSELFSDLSKSENSTINKSHVEKIISMLGLPDGSAYQSSQENFKYNNMNENIKPVHKFFRNPDGKAIGGVCSGVAAYFDIDIIIVRLIAVAALIFGGSGFWIYIIFWIVAPEARTASEKCELRGLPITAENLRKFSSAA